MVACSVDGLAVVVLTRFAVVVVVTGSAVVDVEVDTEVVVDVGAVDGDAVVDVTELTCDAHAGINATTTTIQVFVHFGRVWRR